MIPIQSAAQTHRKFDSIIIIIIIVSFMQGIHIYFTETNHVPRGYIVAAILSLLFMVPLSLVPALALLFFYVSTFRRMCAVPNMAVFCSSLTSWFPDMLRTYFLYYYYYYYYYYYIIVSIMQGSHTHIPGTNHVPRGYIVAAILSLLFMVPLCLVPALALLLLLLLLLLLFTAVEVSLGGSSLYTSNK